MRPSWNSPLWVSLESSDCDPLLINTITVYILSSNTIPPCSAGEDLAPLESPSSPCIYTALSYESMLWIWPLSLLLPSKSGFTETSLGCINSQPPPPSKLFKHLKSSMAYPAQRYFDTCKLNPFTPLTVYLSWDCPRTNVIIWMHVQSWHTCCRAHLTIFTVN